MYATNGNFKSRISTTDHSYIECITGSGTKYLHPSTIINAYLAEACIESDREYTICNLRAKSELNRTHNSIPRNSAWFSYSSYSTDFVIKYENVTITDSNGQTDLIPDMYIIIRTDMIGAVRVLGWRETYPYNHIENSYVHSHLSSDHVANASFYSKSFCTGGSHTPVNRILRNVGDFFRHNAKALSKHIFNEEITVDLNSPVFQKAEYLISRLLGILHTLIMVESSNTNPYKRLRYNLGGSIDPNADKNNEDIDAFAKCVFENAADPRLSFTMSNEGTVSVNTNIGFIGFAKEHGFYKKCFGRFNLRTAMYSLPITGWSIPLKKRQRYDASLKLNLSPFLWKGKRLHMKTTNFIYTNLEEHDTNIKSTYQTRFFKKLTSYFNKGYKMHMVTEPAKTSNRSTSPSKVKIT